jgi:predicted nucleic acid-binding protein
MLVVADTSPLNYLICIDLAWILPSLYGSVVIPPEVRAELLAADAPPIVQGWAADLPSWVEVSRADSVQRDDPRWISLDIGERAAIALATLLQPAVLLIDERAGSAIARGLGLPVTGTLGALDEAARRKLISLRDAIARLKSTSFRYPKSVVDRLLEEDAKRSL